MDVSDYDKAVMSFWRGAGLNLTSITIDFEESLFQRHWTSRLGRRAPAAPSPTPARAPRRSSRPC